MSTYFSYASVARHSPLSMLSSLNMSSSFLRRLTSPGVTAGNRGYADGPLASATLYYPLGLALDASGTSLFFSSATCSIRRINLTSAMVSTLAGKNSSAGSADGALGAAQFYNPSDLIVMPNTSPANVLIVCDVACKSAP